MAAANLYAFNYKIPQQRDRDVFEKVLATMDVPGTKTDLLC